MYCNSVCITVLQRAACVNFHLGSGRGEDVMKAAVAGNIHLLFPAHGCHFILFVSGTAAVTESTSVVQIGLISVFQSAGL